MPACPQQISKGIGSGVPGWKSEVDMPYDRDDETNLKNFAKALAITSGFPVSVELSRLL